MFSEEKYNKEKLKFIIKYPAVHTCVASIGKW